jgi:hypothetical protein
MYTVHEPQPLGLKDPVFRIMSKDFFRYMRSEPFSQLIGGRSVADLLGDVCKPLIIDSLELAQLIRDRHIKPELSDSYGESSFLLHDAGKIVRMYAFAAARRRSVDKSLSAVTKTLTRLEEAHREAYGFQLLRGTYEARLCAQTMISIESVFFKAYATALYMRTAFAKLLEQGNESGIAQQLMSAHSYWRTRLQHHSPNISCIGDIFTGVDKWLPEILRGLKTASFSVSPPTSHLVELHEMYEAGVAPVDSYVQLPTQHGLLQCRISPLGPEWRSVEYSGNPKCLAKVQFLKVPLEHSGYYKGPICTIDGQEYQDGLIMILRDTGTLCISANLVPLDVILPSEIAKYLETQMIQLAYEASTGSYETGMITPDVPPTTVTTFVPEHIESDPEDDDTFTAKLPRDMRGAKLVAAIRSMNRTFYRDQGLSGMELDAQAEPLLRQKGSHATIFCAETNRIATVPVHSVALRVGTLKNVLRTLRLEPARLMEAI